MKTTDRTSKKNRAAFAEALEAGNVEGWTCFVPKPNGLSRWRCKIHLAHRMSVGTYLNITCCSYWFRKPRWIPMEQAEDLKPPAKPKP